MWQQRYTEKLLRRIKRNQYVRAVALGIASGTAVTLSWTPGTDQPDIDLSAQRLASQTASGIKPNRILCGDTAWQNRIATYAGTNTGTNQFAAAAAHRLLRIHTLGVHVDFLLPNHVHDKLAAHFTPASCPLRNQQSEISNQQSPL
jgi:hypothetical protein